jgi:hypothetical protein
MHLAVAAANCHFRYRLTGLPAKAIEMDIDAVGEMVDFSLLSEGQLFYCYLNGDRTIAMRFTYVDGMALIVKAVVSFSHQSHPKFPAPMVQDSAQFTNRSVLRLKNATFRTPSDLSKWKEGAPRLDSSGSVMLGTGNSVFVRAWSGRGGLDIDVVSGVAESARNRPEQLWTDEWSIVTDAGTERESILVQSPKPS